MARASPAQASAGGPPTARGVVAGDPQERGLRVGLGGVDAGGGAVLDAHLGAGREPHQVGAVDARSAGDRGQQRGTHQRSPSSRRIADPVSGARRIADVLGHQGGGERRGVVAVAGRLVRGDRGQPGALGGLYAARIAAAVIRQ